MTRWVVTIFLLGALAITLWPSSSSDSKDEEVAAKSRARSTTSNNRARRLTPAETYQRLRRLAGQKSAQGAPTFEEICRMLSRLGRRDLESLIEENDTFGWHLSSRIRSAAFAELARRDPEEALRLAEAYAQEDDDPFRTRSKLDLFSVIRGWAEVDAAAALETLNEYKVESVAGTDLYRVVNDPWKNATFRHVFTHLARQDLEAAIAGLPPKEESSMRKQAWIGLFAGANDQETIEKLSALRQELGDHPYQIVVSEVSFLTVPEVAEIVSDLPTTEEIVINPSVHDAWLTSSPSNEPPPVLSPGSMHQLRLLEMEGLEAQSEQAALGSMPADTENALRLFGERHPQESLRALREDYPESMRMPLARGIMTAYPEHAEEVLSLIESGDQRVSLLTKAIYGKGREREEQLYPLPGEANMLPNHQSQYQHLLNAAESADLSDESLQVVLESLRNEFFGKVPDAELLHPDKN